jgi:prepilin-type N-terminal cleavage/methylation domain-containing protein
LRTLRSTSAPLCPRAGRRGVTLIEIVVGVTIGAIITTAAVAFVRSETRLMGLTDNRLELIQGGRATLDLIAAEVQLAGIGTGLDAGRNFNGIMVSPFTVGPVGGGAGGPAFNGATISLEQAQPNPGTYTVQTQDLGLRVATGEQTSIVQYTGGGGGGTVRVCDNEGLDLEQNDLALIRDELYLATQAVQLSAPVVAPGCSCINGCLDFSWVTPADPALQYLNYAGATNIDYNLGGMFTEYKTVVYFVEDQGSGVNRGQLRRATFDFDNLGTCVNGRAADCGVAVTENVEALFVQLWAFDSAARSWTNVAAGTPVPGDARIRVDVELVMRSRVPTDSAQPPVVSALSGTAFPAAGNDLIQRESYRTSIDIRNSGRL